MIKPSRKKHKSWSAYRRWWFRSQVTEYWFMADASFPFARQTLMISEIHDPNIW